MSTKEKLALMSWCQQAVIALKFQESAEKLEQLKILKRQSHGSIGKG